MAQELKNSSEPYERTKYQELLDGDAFSVLYARPSTGNDLAGLNITDGRTIGVMPWLLMITAMLYC